VKTLLDSIVSYLFCRKVVLAMDIAGLYKVRNFRDGITAFKLSFNSHFYLADHHPKVELTLTILNHIVVTIEIYNILHLSDQQRMIIDWDRETDAYFAKTPVKTKKLAPSRRSADPKILDECIILLKTQFPYYTYINAMTETTPETILMPDKYGIVVKGIPDNRFEEILNYVEKNILFPCAERDEPLPLVIMLR
jgi:hypothetical protein